MAVNDPLQTLYQLMSGRQPIAVKECADQVSLFNDHPVNGQVRVGAFNNYQLQDPNKPNPFGIWSFWKFGDFFEI